MVAGTVVEMVVATFTVEGIVVFGVVAVVVGTDVCVVFVVAVVVLVVAVVLHPALPERQQIAPA